MDIKIYKYNWRELKEGVMKYAQLVVLVKQEKKKKLHTGFNVINKDF